MGRHERVAHGSISPSDLFDLSHPLAMRLFGFHKFPWQALIGLDQFIRELCDDNQGVDGKVSDSAFMGHGPIFIAKGASVEAGAYIDGPCYVGPGAVVRHGAYLRGSVILLDGALIGHSSEAKNAIFLPNAHAPHFAYVGDSVLGNDVNLGAGTKLSNLAVTSAKDPGTGSRPSIVIDVAGQRCDTTLTKLGAIIGDGSQTGCNVVLNPGTVLGRNTLVYPNVSLRKGVYPPDVIVKLRQEVLFVERR